MHKKTQRAKSKEQNLHNILLEIVAKKRQDLLSSRPDLSLESFQKEIPKLVRGDSKFKKAIVGAKEMAFIGEIKFASPANPSLGSTEDLLPRAKLYTESGVDVISIITEPHFFKGDISFVSQVKKNVTIPVLQKDFVIDAFQIYQAKQIGTDALLLIARLLDEEMLKIFVTLCHNLGIEPVVEINDEADLKKAMATTTEIIAVNARDLETFVVDVDAACLLLKKIPKKYITLGFSGVVSAKEVLQYKQAGAKGILVGTSLMKAKDVTNFISNLRVLPEAPSHRALPHRVMRAVGSPSSSVTRKSVKTKVKICGIRNLETAQIAIAAGADFLGFNFVPKSKRYIDPQKAKIIIDQLRTNNKGLITKMVGVFQNSSVNEVNKIAQLLDLDFVQLHGEEDQKSMNKIKKKIIKKIVIPTEMEGSRRTKQPSNMRFLDSLSVARNDKINFFLLDREIQGKGKMVDFVGAKNIAQQYPTFFSGGLTSENIAKVVKKVKPFAVDVAGGIETNGIPDSKKIKKFIFNAKNIGHSGKQSASRIALDTAVRDSGQARMTVERRENK